MAKVKFINLKSTTVTVRKLDGTEESYRPHGKVAKAALYVWTNTGEDIGGVPTAVPVSAGLTLPEGLVIDENTYLIVDFDVLEAAQMTGHPLLSYMVALDFSTETAIRDRATHVVAITRWLTLRGKK